MTEMRPECVSHIAEKVGLHSQSDVFSFATYFHTLTIDIVES